MLCRIDVLVWWMSKCATSEPGNRRTPPYLGCLATATVGDGLMPPPGWAAVVATPTFGAVGFPEHAARPRVTPPAAAPARKRRRPKRGLARVPRDLFAAMLRSPSLGGEKTPPPGAP